MAYYGGFESLLYNWQSWGLSDVILPFLLIFAIVFAALEKASVFGTDKRRMNIAVSLIIGLMVVIPHISNAYPPGADVVDMINTSLPTIAIVLVAILMIMIMTGLLQASGWVFGLAVIAAIVAVVYVFMASSGVTTTPTWLYWINDPLNQSLIVILLVFALVVWLIIGRAPGQRAAGGITSFVDEIGKLFRGGRS